MTRPAGRRAVLPGADELFRVTGAAAAAVQAGAVAARPQASESGGPDADTALADDADAPHALLVSAGRSGHRAGERSSERLEPAPAHRPTRRGSAERGPSGRERHEEKITVYVSGSELVDLERARLTLRADHGLGIDRGRIVREALAVVLADLEAKGEQSILVRRLRGR
ncbi:MAG TPA: cobyrinic acid a,c-diamide synthase [Mycobacteriales bacterium]|jgi:hypothetical protein|nr:cobyrinic acid a,c-diamide synthase [Mycobacteriales bacterium]